MDKFLEKLNRIANAVRLDPERKILMRAELTRSMGAAELLVRPARYSVFHRFLMPTAAFAALALLVGTGTSAAAEKALPGDPLYNVKINLTEPLIGALSVSEESKADWEARIAERRLEEANKLALSGELNEEARAKLADNFSRFADKAEARLAKLNESGKNEAAGTISTRFESSLAAHSRILAKLEVEKGTVSEPLQERIAIALGKVSKGRGDAEDKVQNNGDKLAVAARGKMTAASNVIDSSNGFLEKKSETLSPDALSSAKARLGAAEELLKDAKSKHDSNDYASSFRLANQALRAAQETRVLASAQAVADDKAVFAPSSEKNTLASARVNFLDDSLSASAGAAAMTMGAADVSASSTATSTASSTATSSTVIVVPNSSNLHVEGETEMELRSEP